MRYSSQERPTVAFGLTLAGGIIIILAGLAVMAVGAILTFFIGGIAGIFGLVGVVWGVLIVICASMLRSRPQQHVELGVAIIVLSLLSWVGSFGGFFLGFLLALVGGIMALVWKPSFATIATPYASPVPPVGAAAATPGTPRFCPNCGASLEAGARFCASCGKAL
jgi:hypothetical protein